MPLVPSIGVMNLFLYNGLLLLFNNCLSNPLNSLKYSSMISCFGLMTILWSSVTNIIVPLIYKPLIVAPLLIVIVTNVS